MSRSSSIAQILKFPKWLPEPVRDYVRQSAERGHIAHLLKIRANVKTKITNARSKMDRQDFQRRLQGIDNYISLVRRLTSDKRMEEAYRIIRTEFHNDSWSVLLFLSACDARENYAQLRHQLRAAQHLIGRIRKTAQELVDLVEQLKHNDPYCFLGYALEFNQASKLLDAAMTYSPSFVGSAQVAIKGRKRNEVTEYVRALADRLNRESGHNGIAMNANIRRAIAITATVALSDDKRTVNVGADLVKKTLRLIPEK